MFKYLRTLNTEFHPTVVEFFVSPTNEAIPDSIEKGILCSLNNSYLSCFYSPDKPMYLSLGTKREDETKKVKCMRLSSGMVLEADVTEGADKSQLGIGSLACLGYDIDTKVVGVSTGDDLKKFEVIDNSNIENNKVTVVII